MYTCTSIFLRGELGKFSVFLVSKRCERKMYLDNNETLHPTICWCLRFVSVPCVQLRASSLGLLICGHFTVFLRPPLAAANLISSDFCDFCEIGCAEISGVDFSLKIFLRHEKKKTADLKKIQHRLCGKSKRILKHKNKNTNGHSSSKNSSHHYGSK